MEDAHDQPDEFDELLMQESSSASARPTHVQDDWDALMSDDIHLQEVGSQDAAGLTEPTQGESYEQTRPETEIELAICRSPIVRRPGKGKGRGGGRPTGRAIFREVSAVAEQESEEALVLAQPIAGSIEFARHALAAQRAAKKDFDSNLQLVRPTSRGNLSSGAVECLSKHGDVSQMFLVLCLTASHMFEGFHALTIVAVAAWSILGVGLSSKQTMYGQLICRQYDTYLYIVRH